MKPLLESPITSYWGTSRDMQPVSLMIKGTWLSQWAGFDFWNDNWNGAEFMKIFFRRQHGQTLYCAQAAMNGMSLHS